MCIRDSPLPVDPSGWALEDCLGYSSVANAGSPQAYTTRNNNIDVLGLFPCKSKGATQFGVCSNYNGALSIDENLKGDFKSLNIINNGLLNEFSPNNYWFGSLTAKKLILTSLGGRPKAFDGNTCTTAGFKKWSGGIPLAFFDKNESTCAAGFYGIRVVYRSEKHGIYDFSPVTTVQIPTGETGELLVANIPPHPDPRVSGIEVYRTVTQFTEDLAINGPLFLCESIKGNGFIGTLNLTRSDTNLIPVILDTNITPLPHCELSAILNGKLYMTGDVLDPNKFFWSDPDNPERFDTVVNFDVIKEDSGDIPTGLVSAFGALILMKPNAIWRIDDLGNNRHRQTKIATIGPVTSKSVQLVVEPDTGRELICFWAEQGPYIFDGRSARYIGGPIEEPTVGQDRANEFHWLDSSSVVVAHNSQSRELMFYCKEIKYVDGVVTSTDRAALTLVYNYRFRSWYKYTGMIGTCAVSLSFSEDNNVQTPPSTAGKIPSISRGFKHLLLIGGDNGSIYKYTSAITDGVPIDASNGAAFDNKGIYTISAIDAEKYTLKDSTGTVLAADPAKFDFAGVWLYCVNSNGDFVAAPIKTNHQGVSGIVEIESSWKSFWTFTPVLNDSVYIGLPPAYIEFPWDEAERPFYDKDFKKLITWHNGAFKFKEAIAYDETTFPASWKDLADNDSQRKQTVVNRASDVLKFKIYSFDQQATFDGHAFEIEDRQSGNTAQ